MLLPTRLDGHRSIKFDVLRTPVSGSSVSDRPVFRKAAVLLLAVALLAASDLHGIDSPTARFTATVLVAAALASMTSQWWRSSVSTVAFGGWLLLNISNLMSPLRSARSVLFLTSAALSVALVAQVCRLVGTERVRRFLTTYLTVLVLFAILGLAVSAIATGSLSLSGLRVETSAIVIWKALLVLSPCPTRWGPAPRAFLGFKVVLIVLMIAVDRPKLGVLLAMASALAVGAIVLGLGRSTRSPNATPMLFASCSIVGVLALVIGKWLAMVYARGSDFSGRTVLWRTAIEEMEQARSIFGVGFRNSLTSADAINALSPRFERALGSWGNAVHNVYLQLVVELGVFGVAILAVVLTTSVVGLLRIKDTSKQASLAIDLVFLLGLCFVEPVLEPNRVVFVLLVLTILRIHEHAGDDRSSADDAPVLLEPRRQPAGLVHR